VQKLDPQTLDQRAQGATQQASAAQAEIARLQALTPGANAHIHREASRTDPLDLQEHQLV
jgi:hypothetical protein